MQNVTPRTLEQMQHYATTYEVVVETADGTKFTAAFMNQKNKHALIAVARDNSETILAAIPDSDDPEWSYTRKSGLSFGPYARVYYTGRTERDVRNSM